MRYEPEEFERLKDYVDEFMKRGPLGDIFTPFFYKPYPYNQTENVLDTLRFADARKLLIDYLYKVSRAKSIEVTRQTEGLIGELWEYGYPDKNRESDFLKNLAWDICRMTKSVDYWQWEAMRLPGESESDVVRRTYQEIKNPEKRREFMQFWIDYLERMRPKYELEIQAAEVLTRLNKGFTHMETPFMERIKVLVENKKFLDSQKYHDASIYYILKKEQDGAVSYKGVAEYEQEMAVYFSISKEEVTEIYIGDTSVHEDLFKPMEEGYKIAAITMDGHFNVWDELDREGLDALPHREGFEDYLIYCKERNITAASITASIGWSVGDLLDEVKLQKQDYMNHVSQAEKGLDSEKTEMAGKPPCKGQGKKNGYNGYLEKRRQDIEI